MFYTAIDHCSTFIIVVTEAILLKNLMEKLFPIMIQIQYKLYWAKTSLWGEVKNM